MTAMKSVFSSLAIRKRLSFFGLFIGTDVQWNHSGNRGQYLYCLLSIVRIRLAVHLLQID